MLLYFKPVDNTPNKGDKIFVLPTMYLTLDLYTVNC